MGRPEGDSSHQTDQPQEYDLQSQEYQYEATVDVSQTQDDHFSAETFENQQYQQQDQEQQDQYQQPPQPQPQQQQQYPPPPQQQQYPQQQQQYPPPQLQQQQQQYPPPQQQQQYPPQPLANTAGYGAQPMRPVQFPHQSPQNNPMYTPQSNPGQPVQFPPHQHPQNNPMYTPQSNPGQQPAVQFPPPQRTQANPAFANQQPLQGYPPQAQGPGEAGFGRSSFPQAQAGQPHQVYASNGSTPPPPQVFQNAYQPPQPQVVQFPPVPPSPQKPAQGIPMQINPQQVVGPAGQGYNQSWNTGLFDFMDDPMNALVTLFFPCVTFGQVAEIVDSGNTSCGTSGMLYGLIAFCIAMPCIMSCSYRTKLRAKFGLVEAPAPDWVTHFFCEYCALCQEYRELQHRGYDPAIGWQGNVFRQNMQQPQVAMMPPMNQRMMG